MHVLFEKSTWETLYPKMAAVVQGAMLFKSRERKGSVELNCLDWVLVAASVLG
jgi:hypothetical protein